MAHNLSWIDPDALRALVAQTAYRPVEPERAAPAVPTTRPEPAARAPLTQQPRVATQRPRPSVRRASRPSLPNPDEPSVPAAPPVRAASVEPFGVDRSRSLEARLEQLMSWACRATGLSRAFVADEEGLLVASQGFGANAVDEAAAMVELCTRQLPVGIREAEAATVTMTALERTHVFAWQRTRHGRTYLALQGTVVPAPDGTAQLCSAILGAVG